MVQHSSFHDSKIVPLPKELARSKKNIIRGPRIHAVTWHKKLMDNEAYKIWML
jgi:di/tripeptidase